MARTEQTSFRIATYNIHSCLGTDRQFSPSRIVEVIHDLNADIVALQEVGWHLRGQKDFDQFSYLAAETGYHVSSGPVKAHANAHFGNALLTRVPVQNLRLLDLSISYRVPRGAIDADVVLDGRRVRIMNAHLGLDPWERQQQIRRLLTAADNGHKVSIILMGDFNEWRRENPAMQALSKRFPNYAAPQSFHARQPLLRFDRIYASEDLILSEVEVVRTALARQASDHLPVRACAGWPAASLTKAAAK